MDLGRLGLQPDVVAIERDVQDAHGDVGTFDLGELRRESTREVIAAVRDAHQRKAAGPFVPFDDLVRDTRERPAHVGPVQQLPAHTNAPLRVRGRALRLWHIYRSLPGLAGPDLKGGSS